MSKSLDRPEATTLARLVHYITQELKSEGVSYDSVVNLDQTEPRTNLPPISTNCGVDPTNIDDALAVMEATQKCNTRAAKKTYHLIVSFAAGENPSAEVLRDIETELMKSVGLDDHQRIRAVHNDTEHLHMHIACNLIHPETHKSIQPSRDWVRLSRCAAELETKHELVRCADRHSAKERHSDELLQEIESLVPAIELALDDSADWRSFSHSLSQMGLDLYQHYNGIVVKRGDESGYVKGSALSDRLSKVALVEKLGEVDNEIIGRIASSSSIVSERAKSIEHHRGVMSFQSWIEQRRDVLKEIFLESADWRQLHEKLNPYGLAVLPRRRGMVLVNLHGHGSVKVSALGQDVTGPKLVRRLGELPKEMFDEFLESSEVTNHCFQEQPVASLHQGLWEKYGEYRREEHRKGSDIRSQRKLSIAAGLTKIDEDLKREFARLRRSMLVRGIGRRMAYRRLMRQAKDARQALKMEAEAPEPVRNYRTWLVEEARTGDEQALRELQSISDRLGVRHPWESMVAGGVGGNLSAPKLNGDSPPKIYRDGNHRD